MVKFICSKCNRKINKLSWLNTKPVCIKCFYDYRKNRLSEDHKKRLTERGVLKNE